MKLFIRLDSTICTIHPRAIFALKNGGLIITQLHGTHA